MMKAVFVHSNNELSSNLHIEIAFLVFSIMIVNGQGSSGNQYTRRNVDQHKDYALKGLEYANLGSRLKGLLEVQNQTTFVLW